MRAAVLGALCCLGGLLSPLVAQVPGADLFNDPIDFFALELQVAELVYDEAYAVELARVIDAGLPVSALNIDFNKTGSGASDDPNIVFEGLRNNAVWRRSGVGFQDFMAMLCAASLAWELSEAQAELVSGIDADLAALQAALDRLRNKPRLLAQAQGLIEHLTALRQLVAARSAVSNAPAKPKGWVAPPLPEPQQDEPTMWERMRNRMKRRMAKMRAARRAMHEAIFNP